MHWGTRERRFSDTGPSELGSTRRDRMAHLNGQQHLETEWGNNHAGPRQELKESFNTAKAWTPPTLNSERSCSTEPYVLQDMCRIVSPPCFTLLMKLPSIKIKLFIDHDGRAITATFTMYPSPWGRTTALSRSYTP